MSKTNNVTRAFNNFGLKVKKHSPEILVVAGVVGTVTAAVMACKATTKLNDILEDTKQNVAHINEATEQGSVNGVEYTQEDGKKDLAIIYTKTAVSVAKLYAPSVILGALSLTSIVASNRILHKRNAGLAAAYALVDKSFKEYRGRVVERFGKELDRELKYNIKTEEVETRVVDENGKEKVVKEHVKMGHLGDFSEFAVFFDEYNPNWVKDAECNKAFLMMQQNYANEMLQKKGHVFLNEVYDLLGIDRTKAGNIVGWVYDKDGLSGGDNFIDFGMFDDIRNPRCKDFINGRERSILLDFNVDGNVLDLLP